MEEVRSIDRQELAWAAGLFEGEGCITVSHNGSGTKNQPVLRLNMIDEDTVRRFQRAVGCGPVKAYVFKSQGTRKPQFWWYVTSFEKVQAVLAMLWFGLGQRRRVRAVEVLRLGLPTR
jgi:hypothetical protein